MDDYYTHAIELYTRLNTALNTINNDAFILVILINHAFIMANIVLRDLKQLKKENAIQNIPFLAGLVLTVVTGLGGAILVSLLTAKPMIFLELDIVALVFIVAWTLVSQFPGQLVHYITGNPAVELVTYAIQGVFIGTALVDNVDNGAKLFPARVFAPVILGTIACIGGGVLAPMFINLHLGENRKKSFFVHSEVVILPLLLSAFYFGTKYLLHTHTFTHELNEKFAVVVTPEMIVKTILVVAWLGIWLRTRVLSNNKAKAIVSSIKSKPPTEKLTPAVPASASLTKKAEKKKTK